MVKVYFEIRHKYAYPVAIFDNEETYNVCIPALEELAKKRGFNLMTESVEPDNVLEDVLKNYI